MCKLNVRERECVYVMNVARCIACNLHASSAVRTSVINYFRIAPSEGESRSRRDAYTEVTVCSENGAASPDR